MSGPTVAGIASPDAFAAQLDEIACAPQLLVASDFDGTIAPIVAEPSAAEADREALVALKALAAMPQTHVALVSGRSLSDLASRATDLKNVHLVGSHGSEFEAGFVAPLSDEAAALLARITASVRDIAGSDSGLLLEEKPASLALHYRNAAPDIAQRVVEAVRNGPATWPGVYVRQGKMVIELSVIETNKGVALSKIRRQLGATAVLFFGDDVTDEDAFKTLSGPDVGVKVGPGESAARFRVSDTLEVARLLARVAELRTDWLAGSHATPIEQHSLLSDQRTAALVDPRGRIVWLCLPRIDSSAVFAELLGGPTVGFFQIAPAAKSEPAQQRYVGDTFILESTWPTIRLIDYLDCSSGRAFQRAGRSDLIRVVEGTGRVRVVFSPRLDFGRRETRLSINQSGVSVEGTVESLVLRAPGLNWRLIEDGHHQTAVAEFEVGAAPFVFEMRYGTANLDPLQQDESQRRERTAQFWSGWAATLRLPAIAREHVRRSALVLKALTYGPTGAIAAAATTSLPEHLGGVRNWDYRYCWPRDAAMAATALLRLGAVGPATKLIDWILGILDDLESSALFAPIYTVTGGHLGAEGEIGALSGYCGSRPVRVGNAAAQQIQLDVLGPIAELVAGLADCGAALSAEHWRLVTAMVAAVEQRWREPDHGIWEARRARQHHVHSKVMCWQTVDRGLRVARYLGRSRPDWAELREQIAADIQTHGWNESKQAFCATYEDSEPDAAALSVGLSGLLAASDPRFVSTVQFVERNLREGPTVYRYRYDDGLPGVEGGFSLCTAWLIEAYEMIGRRSDAEELFGALINQAGPTGLLTEEFDPVLRRALGNFPQAYSHLGLIQAALRLDRG